MTDTGFYHTLAASWSGLLNYLDRRWFYRTLSDACEKCPDASLRATVEGNLEVVLDDHH